MGYMDIDVLHNGEDISAYLDNYTRQQKICTGIGTLEISFANTVARTFEPWDIIELYEEGIKKGTYYVDIASNSIPDSLITLSCRDGVKKLMDYFIPDSYFVDYPSYSRTWIEQFLEEAQVNYEFNVVDLGTLLSNNTSLGNSSTYDQIIPLLQMSGWYIYFDADGKAVIGKLQTDLSSPSISLGKTDILTIKQSKNDKMLRNRVVVWGGMEEATSTLVAAEASITTPWNYDEYDLRTSVISSSSIRSYDSAFSIANMALSEFAQITSEKTLECHGERNVTIGDFVSVDSDVFSGVGLATTVGSTFNKDGFKTNIILDERCPRLFAFFDFGDFVYVSTVGEGVWRKPIDGDDWQDYSVGLADNRVTDLYKNSGILSAVTMSGVAYYNIEEDGIWFPIDIQNLSTAMPDEEGELIPGMPYSGGVITARAVIQDRITNNLRIAAGSNDSENYIDYATGKTILSSGVLPRSWIVDFNANSAAIEKVYPIQVGDFYNYDVLDIENDGAFDYVTVAASGWLVVKMDEGKHGVSEGIQWHPLAESVLSYSTMEVPLFDYNVIYGVNTFGTVAGGITGGGGGMNSICTYDTDALKGVVGPVYNSVTQKQYIFGRFIDFLTQEFGDDYEVEIPNNLRVLAIHQVTEREYTIFSKVMGLVNTYSFGTIRFNSESYTLESQITITSSSGGTPYVDMGADNINPSYRVGPIVWGVKIEQDGPNSRIYGLSVDMRTSSYTETLLLDCGGSADKPNRLSINAVVTPLAEGGILVKVARCYMEVNIYGLVSSARVSVVNFRGPNFLMFEQEQFEASGVELYRWPETNVAVLIQGQNNAVTSTANMAYAWAQTFHAVTVRFVRSVYPLNDTYDMNDVERPFRIGRYYGGPDYANSLSAPYWQAGKNFTTTIFGLGRNGVDGIFNFYTGNRITSFEIPEGFSRVSAFPHIDSITDEMYIFTKHVATGDYYILGYSISGELTSTILFNVTEDIPDFLNSVWQNAENWVILTSTGSTQFFYIQLYSLGFAPIINYSVLKREKDDFSILKTDFKNMRLDDSLGMPLVSVSDKLKTTSLMRNYASGYSFTNILSDGALQNRVVHDFKYTSTGITSISGIVPSSGVARTFLYANDLGINSIPMEDSLDLSEDEVVFGADAGIPYRLETSNYKFPNQRIFTVTSGEAGNRFFQSDPVISGFSEYTSGFPQTVITRIRLDDRL